MIDADSEFFTAVNVLPANGNESADTLTLVDQETSAQENKIEQLSIDGAGFDGPVLRELEDERGIQVFVPPKQTSPAGRFGSEDFTVSEDGSRLTVRVSIKSNRLQDPLKYTLSYKRGEG